MWCFCNQRNLSVWNLFEQMSSARSCTKFRIALSWNTSFLPNTCNKCFINLCLVAFFKPHISQCFPVAFQNCIKGGKSLSTGLLPPYASPVVLHMSNCMTTRRVESLEGLHFQCWCMPANLNIKSDGNQQRENMQSALGWNAHLSDVYCRSLAPIKVVWDNKRACFESSDHFLVWLFLLSHV